MVELIGPSLIVLAGGGDFLWGVVLVAVLVLETTCYACVCEQQGKKVIGEWWWWLWGREFTVCKVVECVD